MQLAAQQHLQLHLLRDCRRRTPRFALTPTPWGETPHPPARDSTPPLLSPPPNGVPLVITSTVQPTFRGKVGTPFSGVR